MRIREAIRAASMVVAISTACVSGRAAGVDTHHDVELVAARHMLQRYPSELVVIDSGYAHAKQAPGHPSGQGRPASRTRTLAKTLRATVGSSAPDGGVHLILSEPMVSGDSARITVTVQWKGGPGWRTGRSGYHTQAVTLVRQARSWRIAHVVDLGIS